MTITKVTVGKRPPKDFMGIEIEIKGDHRAGKTLIAALLQETLAYHGFRDVVTQCMDGDQEHVLRRIKRIDLRDQRCLDTRILILDENKPLSDKGKSFMSRVLNVFMPKREDDQ